MKKTWEGINNLLARKLKKTKPINSIRVPTNNDSVTCDQRRIANVLNDHFASVGPKLANTPFAVHLQKTNIHLCPNLFHYGQDTLINTNMTFICAEGTFKNNICICVNIQNHQKINNTIL